MDKAAEFRKHAEECRRLAEQMENSDQRAQLLRMAQTWDQLAKDRAQMLDRNHRETGSGVNRRDDLNRH